VCQCHHKQLYAKHHFLNHQLNYQYTIMDSRIYLDRNNRYPNEEKKKQISFTKIKILFLKTKFCFF
jgi:hypothetical protein